MDYSIKYICSVVGGRWVQFHADAAVEQLLLDSRRLIFPSSSLFFALKGPRRDGSRYVAELYKRGVRNFVVGVDWAVASLGATSEAAGPDAAGSGLRLETGMPEANIIAVDDTLAALQALAAAHRRAFSLPVIGVTGSNGKTIVKEWLNELLAPDYHIVRSPKSYNSQIGVALSVWQLQAAHQLAIFEAGISRPGEMERLEPMIRPTIGVFTNIGEAHSEGFDSLAGKAAEKLKLFAGAEVLIYCSDQRETGRAVRAWATGRGATDEAGGAAADGAALGRAAGGAGGGVMTTAAGGGATDEAGLGVRLFSWGREEGATVRVTSQEAGSAGTTVTIVFEGAQDELMIPFTDHASVENALHCVCVMLWLKRPMDIIKVRLEQLASIAMRLELKSGINHCSVINDSYSADLSSLAIALDFLAAQQQHTRRSVILSDLLESGRKEAELYASIAQALGQKKVDRLIGIGTHIGAHADAFAQWFPGEAVFYPTVEAFKHDLGKLHFRDETILIKGARIFEFEEIDRLLTERIHQTVMEVDLNALANNLREYRSLLQPGTRVMAMVKAFGYGSGSFEIANLLEFHGIDYLGVAYADEGVVLRKAGIRVPIMVMNTEVSSYDSLVEYNLEPVIYSPTLLKNFDRWLKKEGIPAFPVHIELETGMNRLGFAADSIDELVSTLPAAAFRVVSVFSHFAASEDAGQDGFSQRQSTLYRETAHRLETALGYSFLRHLANSAGIVRRPEDQMDMVRLGIGLYGIDSANSHRLDLQEVSTLKTTIAQIKQLHQGDTVGYNRRGLAAKGTVTATVRIGYADGYRRDLGNGVGKMWVNGHLAPTIGIISMDMTMIDITGIPDVREGGEVIVFGKELSVSDLAAWAGTIPYEILTAVSGRVKRVYFEQ
ncbi:MAG TPA: bifunctional UDP-N-acetylmuramoyl-tripeptide:D-alanyl-D-alanine ligase/alanine racemase [Puia sp.]|nr:bifunctional UDP-N-acetylmuramoyl-tripeptide:D-alanyl-D-alanine ligase/alanine racemase [Puia sp.]